MTADPFGEPPSAPVLQTLRRTVAAAPPFVVGLGVTTLLAVLGSAALLAGPLVTQRVLDTYLTPAGLDLAAVTRLGAVGLAIGFAGAAANRRAVERMLVRTAEGTAHLRVAVLDRLHQLPLLQLQSERRGALVSRVTSDLDTVTDFMGWGGVGFLVGLIRVVAALVAIAVVEWRVAIALLPLLLVYAAVLRSSQRVLERAHDGVRAKVSTSLGAVGEVVAGLATIRAHGAESRMRQRVDVTVEEQFRAEVRVGILGGVLFSSAELFAGGLTVAVLVASVRFAPGVSVGDVVATLFLVTLLLDPIQTMVETLHEAQAAMAGLRRVLLVLDTPPVLDPARATIVVPAGPIGVSVSGLTWAYEAAHGGEPGERILDDVSVIIEARRHVAVVGETGSGKTTFVKLLARLLHAPPGTIEVGGVALETLEDTSLRRRVAFVPQEVFLFDGTIAENLRRGRPDATDDDLRGVLRRLDIGDWVDGLQDGLDTAVGERGSRLSAGERQLVALARAALVEPDLLLLDEATSAVDPDLEVRLRHAVELLGTDRTVVTVAHRLSTAEAADDVVVFDAGRIVQQGAHDDLLRDRDGVYARLHADWTAGTAAG